MKFPLHRPKNNAMLVWFFTYFFLYLPIIGYIVINITSNDSVIIILGFALLITPVIFYFRIKKSYAIFDKFEIQIYHFGILKKTVKCSEIDRVESDYNMNTFPIIRIRLNIEEKNKESQWGEYLKVFSGNHICFRIAYTKEVYDWLLENTSCNRHHSYHL